MARYTIEGVEYPSCTEIIDECFDKSDGLTAWASTETVKFIQQSITREMSFDDMMEIISLARFKYRDASKNAMDTGTIVHGLIEDYIKFGIDKTSGRDYNDNVINAFHAFLAWEKENDVKWIESEMTIYDPDICVAGRLDAVCYIKGVITVIDFKSSKAFYDGYDLQISAYFKIYNNMLPAISHYNTLQCGILRLDKETGMPEYKDYSKNIDRKYEAFLKLVDFFYLYKKRRLKNNKRAVNNV